MDYHICVCIYYNTLVDCEWGNWVEGDCSTTCGAGKQNNTRSKLIEAAHGGNCTGDSTEVQSCLVVECPGKYSRITPQKELDLTLSIMYLNVGLYI